MIYYTRKMADNVNIEELAKLISENGRKKDFDERIESLIEKFEHAKENNASSEYLGVLARNINRLQEAADAQKKAAEDLMRLMMNRKDIFNKGEKYDQEAFNEAMTARVKWMKLQMEINHLNERIDKEKNSNHKNNDEIKKIRGLIKEKKRERDEISNDLKSTYSQKALNSLKYDKKQQKELEEQILKIQEGEVDNLHEMYRAEKKNNEELNKAKENWQQIKNVAQDTWRRVKDGANLWLKFNEQAISDAKRLGMTSKSEAMSYTKNLIDNAKELSRNFAVTAEQAMKMQDAYVKVTGRASLLSRSQMEDIAASSKLMGDETVQGAIKIMDSMGSTSQSTLELLDRNYARAKNAGVDIQKASEALVQNLTLANKLNFRGGVDGISRMTIYSQRIRMNLQEVANVAEKFSTIEGALEGSARLQMLGGTGGLYGNNPMQMMYEAMADPEALFKRMGEMFGSQAYFNKSTGQSEISPVQMQIIKEQAKAMGMNPDEAIQSAKQQGKLRSIEEDLRASRPSLFRQMTPDQKTAIGNKAEYTKESGWTVTYFDEDKGEKVTAALENLSTEQLEKITKDNHEPLEDIRDRVRDIAKELIGTKERYNAMKEQWYMGIAKLLHLPMTWGDSALTGVNGSSPWGIATGGGLGSAASLVGVAATGLLQYKTMKLVDKIGINLLRGASTSKEVVTDSKILNDTIKTEKAVSGTKNAFSFSKASRKVKDFANTSKFMKGASAGSTVGSGALAIGAELLQAGLEYYGAVKQREADEDRIKKSKGIKNVINGGSRFRGKELDYQEIASKNKESVEKGGALGRGIGATIGGVIGGVVGGPLGAAVGAAAGGYIGNWAGKKFTSEEYEGKVGEHLKEINKDSTKENIRKIILPVESIDYNVSLIANRMGIASAMPARGNIYLESEVSGEHMVEVQQINASDINKTESNVANQSYNPNGKVSLNVSGAIELNMKGVNIGNLSPADFKKLFDSSPELQRAIADAVMGQASRRGNFGTSDLDNTYTRNKAMYNSDKTNSGR